MWQLILQDWFVKGKGFFALDKEELFLFVPVFLGVGVALYFSFQEEPSVWLLSFLVVIALISVLVLRKSYPFLWVSRAFFLIILGLVIAFIRTSNVKSPVLNRDYKSVEITAMIEMIDRKPKQKWRLKLRPLSMRGFKKSNYPFFIRLGGRQKNIGLFYPGQVIRFKAALFRPSRPSIPEGYDFARRVYFQKIGAVGYIISHIRLLKKETTSQNFKERFFQKIEVLRQAVTARVRTVLPDQEGAIAAALLTGKRSGIAPDLYDDIRHSGLAHLLAISGLHMAVMAGTLFWLSHLILAFSAWLALGWPIRKWAVLIAFIGATFYLLLSGASIATQRAYIMLVIGFLAILLDRPALTLRNLALAACIILVFSPESLLEAGFQMSFSTTAALIAFYEYRQARLEKNIKSLKQNWLGGYIKRFVGGVFLTSLIAGFAVIPFAAFHFHQMAVYSLIGNLFVMPIFVFVVMPMTLLTFILMPFGLEAVALKVMAFGLSYIIQFSHYVASWEGAVFSFPIFPMSYFLFMVTGFVILVLLKTKLRILGAFPLIIGLYSAITYQEFDVLIDEKFEAVAFDSGLHLQAQAHKLGYQLLPLSGKKSALERWLKFSDRNYVKISTLNKRQKNNKKINKFNKDQARKPKRQNFSCDQAACILNFKTKKIALIKHRSALYEECQKSDIVILNFPLRRKEEHCPLPLHVITKTDLRKKGAYGLFISANKVKVLTVMGATGQRPWSQKTRQWYNK